MQLTSKQTLLASSVEGPAAEVLGSVLLGAKLVLRPVYDTAIDAPHCARSDWVSRCFEAKLSLRLQRLRGFLAHKGQKLFSAGQVKCLQHNAPMASSLMATYV